MGDKRKWDMTTSSSCAAGAEWFRKQADAILVLVVRGEDIAFAVDPQVAPRDAEALVRAEITRVRQSVEQQRMEARQKAGK